MARLFIDGFESGGLDLWDTINGGAVSTAQYKGGAYSYYVSATTGHTLIKNLASAISTIYFKLWIYITSAGSTGPSLFLILADNSGNQIGIGLDINRKLIFRLNPNISNGGTTLATGTTILALNTQYLIEGKVFIDDTTGIAQCKLNGVIPLEIDFSGDTRAQGTTITKVIIGCVGNSANYNIFGYLDDVVLDDASWIGDTRIQKLQPTGNGSNSNWTPSTGDRWDCVDEIPASDTDYLTTNSNDVIDTYEASNLSGAVTTVRCVQIQARAVKEGSPTPQNLKLAIRSNGGDYLSANKAVPASIKSLFNIWETDPGRSDIAWTPTNVDALEIGIKSAA